MQPLRQHFHQNPTLFSLPTTHFRPRRLLRGPILAQKRSTGRATDKIDPPPRDPFSSSRQGFQGRRDYQRRPSYKAEKEPFEIELVILFGLPALIVVIPWAIKDPASLVLIPVLFLIPGVRDILLTALRSTVAAWRQGKRFMKTNNGVNSTIRREPGTWAPPPRPPPPPPPGGGPAWNSPPLTRGVYDLSNEDYYVETTPNDDNGTYSASGNGIGGEAPSPSTAVVGDKIRMTGETALEEEISFYSTRNRSSWSEEEGDWEETSSAAASGGVTAEVPPPGPRRPRLRVAEIRAKRAEMELKSGTSSVKRRTLPIIEEGDEVDEDFEAMLAAVERRKRRQRVRTARRQRLGLEGDGNVEAAGAVNGLSRRYYPSTSNGAVPRRTVPWYVRPIVLIFPFFKDWGGFF